MKDEVDYVRITISIEEIKPQVLKIQGILDMETLTSVSHIQSFVGMVNSHKSIWPKRSATLEPRTDLTGKGQKFKWGHRQKESFRRHEGNDVT